MNALHSLHAGSPGLIATAVVGPDGELDHASGADGLEEVVAPVGTALLSVAERATAELGRGVLSRVVLEAPQGAVAAFALPGGRTLLIVADASVPLGLVLDDAAAIGAGLVASGEVSDA